MTKCQKNGTERATFRNSEISTLVFQIYTNIFRTTPTYQSLSGIVPVDFAGIWDDQQMFIWAESLVIASCSNKTVFSSGPTY